MNRYAIVENGMVVNIAVADTPMNESWIPDPPVQVQIGWMYGGNEFTAPAIYRIDNQQITANGQPVQFFAGNHYCQPGDTIQMQGEIVDESGNVQTQISLPITLKMPLVRHANGQPTTDEIYLNVTLVNGVITASGKIDRSGDWKILIERNNEALARIGATWKFSAADITFLV